VTWLIRLYPPAWRRRYGRELAELLAAQPASFRTAVDLVAGAVDAWLNPQLSTAVTAANAKGAGAMLPKMLKLRSAGYGANVATADDIKKVWLPGAASCLLFFGFYWVLIWLPFDKTRLQFLTIPVLFQFSAESTITPPADRSSGVRRAADGGVPDSSCQSPAEPK
jgi:hypothetical protein